MHIYKKKIGCNIIMKINGSCARSSMSTEQNVTKTFYIYLPPIYNTYIKFKSASCDLYAGSRSTAACALFTFGFIALAHIQNKHIRDEHNSYNK